MSYTGLSTSQLAYGVSCTKTTPCINGATGHSAGVSLQDVAVTLNDPAAPTLVGVSGPLRTTPWLRGTLSLTTSATDAGGGVASFVLGTGPSTTFPTPLGCDQSKPVPCSLAATATVTLDTRRIGDGPHDLSLWAVDAAGNATSVERWRATVDNTPPPPPARLRTFPPRLRAGQPFTVQWDYSEASAGAPVTSARWRLLDAKGRPVGEGAQTSPAAPAPLPWITGLRLPRPGSYRVQVTQVDAAGQESPAAELALSAGSTVTFQRRGPARARIVGAHALVRVSPAARSRRYRVRVHVDKRIVSAARIRVGARRHTLVVPLPRAARRADRVLLEWRAPGRSWKRAAVRNLHPSP